MVTAADLGHGYSVRDFSLEKEESAFATAPDQVTVDRGPCHPLATVMNQLPLGRPRSFLTSQPSAVILPLRLGRSAGVSPR